MHTGKREKSVLDVHHRVVDAVSQRFVLAADVEDELSVRGALHQLVQYRQMASHDADHPGRQERKLGPMGWAALAVKTELALPVRQLPEPWHIVDHDSH